MKLHHDWERTMVISRGELGGPGSRDLLCFVLIGSTLMEFCATNLSHVMLRQILQSITLSVASWPGFFLQHMWPGLPSSKT